MDDRSLFADEILVQTVVAILVKRLGGVVSITQADIDDVAFIFLVEDNNGRDKLSLRLQNRNPVS